MAQLMTFPKRMILQKEFYFVRHGQTDHNVCEGVDTEDHPQEISLNETGKNQARLIEPLLSGLPIKTICSSPLNRAKETRDIISKRILAPHVEINDLGECSSRIWQEMVRCGMYTPIPREGVVSQFMETVFHGLTVALSLKGPSLIVAHGGVHWAICCLLEIKEHEWIIDNCIPVCFSMKENKKWIARKLV